MMIFIQQKRGENVECKIMMTSSNGNIFRVTGHLCGEFTGQRWIPRTKASAAELWCFRWSTLWRNGWVNNREVGDLRRHQAHYDVIVMWLQFCPDLDVLITTVQLPWYPVTANKEANQGADHWAIKHVAWRPFLWLISWYPLILVKSVQFIWRAGTSRLNLWVLDFQMSYNDLAGWMGTSLVTPIMSTRVTYPISL